MHDKLERRDAWYLRAEDGTVYGPVDLATLKDWCLQGRIEPAHAISADQEAWFEAVDLPALEMDWFALLDDGIRCGPFNLGLIPGLIENGILPESVTLEHRHSGEVRMIEKPSGAEPATPPAAEDLPEDDELLVDASAPEAANAATEPETEANAEPDPATEPGTPLEPEKGEPISPRLEALQRSASDARTQLIENRKALQTLRAEHTVLQDDALRMRNELAAAEEARQLSETQLLEQQDRAAQAEANVENLQAQLDQMKDHYDRLQLENQSQFEKIDDLRALQITQEQRFNHELATLRTKADAKTALLTEAVQLMMHDDDLESMLPSGGLASPRETGHSEEIEKLKAVVQRYERQLTAERDETERRFQTMQRQQAAPLALVLLLLIAFGFGIATLVLGLKLRSASRVDHTSMLTDSSLAHVPETLAMESDRESELQPTSTEPAPIQRNGDLNLKPDTEAAPAAPLQDARQSWPDINLQRATITQNDRTLRIVFHYGLFSTGTRLSPEAMNDLQALAQQLRGHLNGYQLMIEGHTDATPIVSAGSRYVDNFALGMARAEAVKSYLSQQGGLPETTIRTASAGESAPPFSNATEENRLKNRTATLTLMAR